MTLFVEVEPNQDETLIKSEIVLNFKSKIGIAIVPKPVKIGDLPRSEKKTTRVFDNRY